MAPNPVVQHLALSIVLASDGICHSGFKRILSHLDTRSKNLMCFLSLLLMFGRRQRYANWDQPDGIHLSKHLLVSSFNKH